VAGIAVAPGRARQRRGRKKGKRRGRLTGGAEMSAKERKKKMEPAARATAGEDWWAAGPPGRKGKEVSFLFFFFSFSDSFQTNLLNSNSNQTFSNFSQNFIIFLEVTQATKNHAKPNNDAQSLVVSRLIKLSLIF
jgi:hypothetical protein